MFQIIWRHVGRRVHEFTKINAIDYKIIAVYVVLVGYWCAGDGIYETTFVH